MEGFGTGVGDGRLSSKRLDRGGFNQVSLTLQKDTRRRIGGAQPTRVATMDCLAVILRKNSRRELLCTKRVTRKAHSKLGK